MLEILVIDDDKNTRRLMNAILLGAGYTPVLAEDGAMLVGRHYAESTIYQAAAAFEASVDWRTL